MNKKYLLRDINEKGAIGHVLDTFGTPINPKKLFKPNTITVINDGELVLPYTLIIRKRDESPRTISFFGDNLEETLNCYREKETNPDIKNNWGADPITDMQSYITLQYQTEYAGFLSKLRMQHALQQPLIELMEKLE
jgi:hypothetical protein